MKQIPFLLFCSLATLLFSCGGNDVENSGTDASNSIDTVFAGDFYFDTLKGLYLGEIGDSPLTLDISFVSESHATGYNMTKGNKRNISGSVSLKKETVELILNEPGDHKYDGVFRLSMNVSDPSTLTGEWESPSGEIKPVKLTRKPQRYNPDEEVTFESYGRDFQDSLGTLYFNTDGYARYEYYQDNGLATEQLKTVKGSWSRKQDIVTVFWENNSVFPSKRSVFTISRENLAPEEDENQYFQYSIWGDNRTMTEIMYP